MAYPTQNDIDDILHVVRRINAVKKTQQLLAEYLKALTRRLAPNHPFQKEASQLLDVVFVNPKPPHKMVRDLAEQLEAQTSHLPKVPLVDQKFPCHCGGFHNTVVNSRRQCSNCGGKINTIERMVA